MKRIFAKITVALVLCASVIAFSTTSTDANPVGYCPPEGSPWPIRLPDDYYCNVFYDCEFGVLYPHVCPDILHYDVYTEMCNWPDIAHAYPWWCN